MNKKDFMATIMFKFININVIKYFLSFIFMFSLFFFSLSCGKNEAVESKTPLNATPSSLIRAIAYGKPSEVVVLLKNGADPNGSLGEGTTRVSPLMVASALGKIELVSLLLKQKADPSVTFMSYTAEDIAFSLNHREILTLLSQGN
jgi:hypothetical protein